MRRAIHRSRIDDEERKPGSINRMTQKAREEAAKTGELPHEFLWRVSRGENIGDYEATLADRIDASKACAQFFSPKLAAAQVDTDIPPEGKNWRDYSDAELLAIVDGARH